MTDAPETIWTTGNSQTGSWNDSDVRHCPGTEYTRADVAQARIAQLEAALRGLKVSARSKPHHVGETPREYHMHVAICTAVLALKAKP